MTIDLDDLAKNPVSLAERAYVHHHLKEIGEAATIRRLATRCSKSPKNNYGEVMYVSPGRIAIVVVDLMASGEAYHVRGRGLNRLYAANPRRIRSLADIEGDR